jgi:undecaprenyl-diphosphatase
MNQTELTVLIVGFVTAFLSALVGITYFVRYIQTHNFKSFGYYRLVLGAVVLTLFFFSIIN